MPAAAHPAYAPRRARDSVLRDLVDTHLEALIESFQDPSDPEAGMPRFVEKELRAFLDCGLPERGFIRLYCDRCQHEHPLPFSCKARAICSSCGARRMAATAEHLVQRVLPDVPLRQFVLTPPFDLRGLLACRKEVLGAFVRIALRAIFGRLRTWAKRAGHQAPQPGAVTAIHRFTKALALAPHLHILALDGVFVREGDQLTFVEAPAPSEAELLAIAREIFERMTTFLERRGYLSATIDQSPSSAEAWFLRGLAEPSMLTPMRGLGTGLQYGGFGIHAGVTIAPGDLLGREKLVRYLVRPAFAEDQVRVDEDGNVEFTFRRPAKNGQRRVRLEPVAFLRRLTWLIPPPFQHQLRYAGILAPAARDRRSVVPAPPPQIQLVFPIENMRPERVNYRPSWAKLLARVYSVEAERCPKCGERLRPIGAITDPTEAKRHLDRLQRARDPPQLTLALPN